MTKCIANIYPGRGQVNTRGKGWLSRLVRRLEYTHCTQSYNMYIHWEIAERNIKNPNDAYNGVVEF